jgi:hypothetical protein
VGEPLKRGVRCYMVKTMTSLNIGVDSWIIQDGNYGDFSVGQLASFALEFYPQSLKPSQSKSLAFTNVRGCRYRIRGEVVFCQNGVWVLNTGFLAYQQGEPPDYVSQHSWVEGDVNIGIDPFMYFEDLKNRSGIPTLTYSVSVEKILLETTPWLTKVDESGREIWWRDEQDESYQEIEKMDAWKDDNGHASYVLECSEMEGRKLTSAWSGLAMSGLLVKLRGRAAQAQR